ncbi:MAG: sulfite exporter TauE/SafE family protein, partial [Thermoleophilaceae bacterium]|nr:sulfite exporter TauE/SafE family protein [Thermoleophilaceae bacterium]
MPLAAVAAFLGATLQSATGFGFALVLGPALIAVLTPAEALTTLLVLSASLNLLMLFSERRRRSIRWSDVLLLLAAAAPGLVGG